MTSPGLRRRSSVGNHSISVSHSLSPWWRHQMEIPRYWSFVWVIHRSPVNSPHKGQWRGTLMFSLICAWTNNWANYDLRCHRAHYDVTAMPPLFPTVFPIQKEEERQRGWDFQNTCGERNTELQGQNLRTNWLAAGKRQRKTDSGRGVDLAPVNPVWFKATKSTPTHTHIKVKIDAG